MLQLLCCRPAGWHCCSDPQYSEAHPEVSEHFPGSCQLSACWRRTSHSSLFLAWSCMSSLTSQTSHDFCKEVHILALLHFVLARAVSAVCNGTGPWGLKGLDLLTWHITESSAWDGHSFHTDLVAMLSKNQSCTGFLSEIWCE